MLRKNLLLSVLLGISLLIFGCVQYGGGATTTTIGQPATTTIQPTTTQATASPSPTTTISGAQVKEFKVTIFHTGYSPNGFSANVGDKIRFLAITGGGTSSHNHGITIDEFNVNQAVTTEDASNPVVIEFTASRAGTFKIYCKTCWDGRFGRNHPDITTWLEVR